MKLKRHLLTAALTLFCLSAANAQLLRTTVEQGEIEGKARTCASLIVAVCL